MNSSDATDGVLTALRAQYVELSSQADDARSLVQQIEWKLENLRDAISALERMESPVLDVQADVKPSPVDFKLISPTSTVLGEFKSGMRSTRTGRQLRVWGDAAGLDIPLARDDSRAAETVHPALAPYMGGTGQRLRSTAMVADLLASTDETFTREQLKDLFFTTYPREELEKFWDKPDNAFGNALLRATEDGLVHKGKRNGGIEVFIGHAAYEEVMSRRKKPSTPTEEGSDAR